MSEDPDKGRSEGEEVSRNAGALVIGNVLASLADIIVPLVIVRLVGKAEVGSLMALLIVYNTLASIVTTGLPHAATFFLPGRELAERAAVAKRLLRTLGGLGLVASVILVGIGLGGGSWITALPGNEGLDKVDLSPLLFLCLFAPFDIPARAIPTWMVTENRAGSAARFGLMRSIGMNLCTIVPLALGYGANEVAMSLIGLGLLEFLVLRGLYVSTYRGAARIAPPVSVREMLKFGIPLGATDIVSLLGNRLDAFLIMAFFSAGSLAEYSSGAWKIPIVTTVPRLVGTALAPRMVQHFKKDNPRAAIDLWRASISKVSLIVVPVTMVFVVAADDAVRLLFTDDYARAAPVLRWYSLLSMCRVAAFGTVIVATGHSRHVLQAAIFSLVTNLLVSVPLVYFVGFEGPAMGTFLVFFPTVVFYCVAIGRATGLPARTIFPVVAYFRIVAIAALGGALALYVRDMLSVGPAAGLGITAVLVVVPFVLVGHLLGLISGTDWRLLAQHLRLIPSDTGE